MSKKSVCKQNLNSNTHSFKNCKLSSALRSKWLHVFQMVGRQFVPSDNSSQATIRPKRQFVPSDNSSQATIRPKRQFVPSDNSSQATIRPKRQFVPSDNSSQATIRPKRQFVPSDNSSQATVRNVELDSFKCLKEKAYNEK